MSGLDFARDKEGVDDNVTSILNWEKSSEKLRKHFDQFFVPALFCVIICYRFFLSSLRFGRHKADVHRTSYALIFALMRVQ